MPIQQTLNIKYAELCKELGDLQVRQRRIQDRISELHKEIDMMDKLAPTLQALVAQTLSESKSRSGNE